MPSDFLLYGSTGFVGDAIGHLAAQNNLHPIHAGRNAASDHKSPNLGAVFKIIISFVYFGLGSGDKIIGKK
jgi:short subunit dehydrogenase-like uncharacterized protein